jgi:hypothetical protein
MHDFSFDEQEKRIIYNHTEMIDPLFATMHKRAAFLPGLVYMFRFYEGVYKVHVVRGVEHFEGDEIGYDLIPPPEGPLDAPFLIWMPTTLALTDGDEVYKPNTQTFRWPMLNQNWTVDAMLNFITPFGLPETTKKHLRSGVGYRSTIQ